MRATRAVLANRGGTHVRRGRENDTASLLVLLVALGCGGAPPAARQDEDPRALTDQAAEAWASLDPRRASRLAAGAIDAGGGHDAREIAARAFLAEGEPERAIEVLSGISEPDLLALRARAQLARDDLEGARDSLRAAHAHARTEDPWVEAMLPALEATLANGPALVIEGRTSTLSLESLPLPTVRVRADTFETLALVGSGADLLVLDPSLRARSGAIDELTLGDLRVRNVPHTVRSLEAVRDALGQPIGMVIGARLLLRLGATLDGPGGRLVVRSEPAPLRDGETRVAFRMLDGSFLAVETRIGDRDGWMTVDTAGLFPIALGPGADEALGLSGAEWNELDGGASATVTPSLRVGTMEIEGIPVVRGLLDEGHARAVGAPVAGSVGWVLLGQLVTRFSARERVLVFE